MNERSPKVAASAAFGIAALAIALPAAALEPTAHVVEFYNASLNHYFITAFPEEAAMLDAGTAVTGWARTGVAWNAWQGAGESATAVPVCRFFGTPGVGPNSHFYTAERRGVRDGQDKPELDLRGDRVLHRRAARRRLRDGTEPVYRSFYPGATVSESNHRFLPDLTMHQKMAAASTARRRRDVLAAVRRAKAGRHRAPARAGDLRPADAAVAHVATVGIPALSGRAVRRIGLALLQQQVRARRRRRDVLPDRSGPDLRARLLLAVPAAERTSSATRSPTTTSCASASPSRCRRSSSRRASTSTRPTGWRPTSRSSSTTRSAISRTLLTKVTLVVRHGRLPQHGQQRQAGRGHQPERKLRARAPAALLDRPVGAEARRHAPARRQAGSRSRPTTRARSRASRTCSRAGPTRCCRARQQRTHNPKNFLGDMTAVAGQPRHRGQGAARRRRRSPPVSPWRRISPTRSTTSSSTPTSAPFVSQAAHPEARDRRPVAAVRRAHRRGVQQQRPGRARRHEGRGARDPARSRGARRGQARPGLRQAARARPLRDGARRAA